MIARVIGIRRSNARRAGLDPALTSISVVDIGQRPLSRSTAAAEGTDSAVRLHSMFHGARLACNCFAASGSSSSTPITVSPTTAEVEKRETASFTAAIEGAAKTAGVQWSVQEANGG